MLLRAKVHVVKVIYALKCQYCRRETRKRKEYSTVLRVNWNYW